MGKAKLNIPMCAAAVLLFLTLLSIHLTSGLFARYTTTVTASDSARVAKFDVVGEITPAENEEGKFLLKVTNNSDVAVQYRIDVIFSNAMSVTIDGETKSPEAGSTTVSFTNSDWKLAPAALSAEHEMLFAITDWSQVTQGVIDTNTATKAFAFSVDIHAEQID